MRQALLGTVFGVGGLLLAFFLFRGFYAMFKAAANRKPGVSYLVALNNMSLAFRRSLYTPEGQRWSVIYLRCSLGFFGVAIAMWIVNVLARR
jgi:hypothetical protein